MLITLNTAMGNSTSEPILYTRGLQPLLAQRPHFNGRKIRNRIHVLQSKVYCRTCPLIFPYIDIPRTVLLFIYLFTYLFIYLIWFIIYFYYYLLIPTRIFLEKNADAMPTQQDLGSMRKKIQIQNPKM
jgi:hypothetical protein